MVKGGIPVINLMDVRTMQGPENMRIEIIREHPCNLPHSTGPCLMMLQRFYYDPSTASCKQFVYGGCGGNDNNFVRIKDCEMRCSPKKTLTTTTSAAEGEADRGSRMKVGLGIPSDRTNTQVTRRSGFYERCHLPKESGSCLSWIPSFYYDVESGTCQNFTYGGCFGNANRFSTLAECESICKSQGIQGLGPTPVATVDPNRVKPVMTPTIRRILPDAAAVEPSQNSGNGTQEEGSNFKFKRNSFQTPDEQKP